MTREEQSLFYGEDLGEHLRRRQQQALAEIDAFDPDRLLGTIPEDLVAHLVAKYGHEPLVVDGSAVEATVVDALRDARWEPGRDVRDTSRPVYVPATVIEFHIPYAGHTELLGCRASQYTLSQPRGIVGPTEITVRVDASAHDADSARVAFERVLAEINRHIEWTNADVAKHNDQLRHAVMVREEVRRKKLLADRGLEASLGFRIRPRKGASPTAHLPLRRKRIAASPPASAQGAFHPEPALREEDYEDILRVMMNMVDVMERSPQAFRTMREEDLRQHFLVQLNGRYEGSATGETFNFEGKTDILVRRDGGNVFVAECKFWRGSKEFAAAIDQLLDYVTWRDTKTALLVFNRNKNMSAVMEKIKAALATYSRFKRLEPFASETGFRCRLSHKNDSAREIVLTVLVFDVPGDTGERASRSS